MRRSARPWGWLAGLSLGLRLALGGLPAHAQPPALFSAVEADATAHAATPTAEADPAGPTILRQRLVALDSALLATTRAAGQAQAATATPPTLSLNLFADAVFPATVTRVEATRSGGYALAGHLDGHPLSTFTLVVNGDTVAGAVLTPWDRYQIHTPPAPSGGYEIRQVDPTSLPDGADPLTLPNAEQPAAPAAGPRVGGADSTTPTVIDVAVFYTPAARRSWGGSAQAEAAIDLFVVQTNQAYVDSEVNQRIRLVHRSQVNYTEASHMYTDLSRFYHSSDGHMDEVHTIRDQVGADLAALIIGGTGGQGGGGAYKDLPWSVAVNFGGSSTFAHELGHNMGLNHDRASTPNPSPPDPDPVRPPTQCSFGYVNQRALDEENPPASARWRTIMSYNNQCDAKGFRCTELLRFSNAGQTYNGDRLGIPCRESETTPASARETLNHTASTVAGWKATVDAPIFLTGVADRTYLKGSAVPTLPLPEASAGDGPLTYSLSPTLPTGLTFDATTRTISGTPTTASTETTYTYTATDTDDPPDTASRTFTLTVVKAVPSLCTASDPAVNGRGEGLAGDCNILLWLKDGLRGNSTTNLNWAKSLAIEQWNGITVSGDPARVTGLNLKSKGLAGSLPAALASLPGLATLNLSDNQLKGNLPALTGLTNLTTLDLSDNELTGGIPFQVGQPPLTTLTTLYAASNDTLCLPRSLRAWHNGLAGTQKDFLVLCLPNTTPPYHLTWNRNVPISPVPVEFVGSLRSLESAGPLPPGLQTHGRLSQGQLSHYEITGTPQEPQAKTSSTLVFLGRAGSRARLTLATSVQLVPPYFGGNPIPSQTYTQDVQITSWSLPTALGGKGALTYDLSPTLPAGLAFHANDDDATLPPTLSGTPTATSGWKTYTYTATDANEDVARLSFSLAVVPRRTGGTDPGTGNSGGGGGGVQPADQHGNTPATATRVAVGSSTPGQINARTDQDYFTLTVPQPGLLVIETSGSTDTHGTLTTPDGHVLAQADSGGTRRNFQVTQRVTAGTYLVAVTGTRTGSYRLTVDLLVGFVDNPQPDSAQSGIGVLSGWVCEAETVEVELNGVLYQAAYGTERTDTVDQCGDTNNGFGLLYNWNKLGDGVHTVRVLVDGIEFATLPVSVTTLGLDTEFPTGLTGETTLLDFPTDGESVRLVWQEAQQNFALADGPVTRSGTTRDWTWAVLGNPAPGSYQSGVRVISGWVCEAEEEVVVEIDGTHRLVAAYGTERADTEGHCGDTNNGFGLLWNWNKLADGLHTMRLLVDGEEWATATFTVTTLGEEFRRGLVHTGRVWDFPGAGEVVTVEWQEAQQNFVVTGVD